MTESLPSELELLDWKRRVFALYQQVRDEASPKRAWEAWRRERDDLFGQHPQSPVPADERSGFNGLPYFEYDSRYRVTGTVVAAEPETYDIRTSGEAGGSYRYTRFAITMFDLGSRPLQLDLYWLEGYGGGVFLPFRDGTSGKTTYGAGRYLLDTVKGADLGMEGDHVVLDFNFAYNPSCAYDPRWVCPLAPPPNRLQVPVEAGERYP